MKKVLYISILSLPFIGCKPFHYYPSPVNASTFANQGEVQVSGNIATSGFLTKGGVAVTDKLWVNGLYNSATGSSSGYYSDDYECAAGWNFSDGSGGISLYAGYGWGNNYHLDSGATVKDFRGNYAKPFFIFNFGTARIEKSFFAWGDVNAGVKLDYLMYAGYKTRYENGMYTDVSFNPEHFLYSPYVNTTIGGKYFRFETGTSFTFKRLSDIGKGVRVFPFQIQFGIAFILFRDYEAPPL